MKKAKTETEKPKSKKGFALWTPEQRKEYMKNVNTSKRGFASMTAEQRKAIASKGGKAAHAKGTAHTFTPEEAAAAGRKGGSTASKRRKNA